MLGINNQFHKKHITDHLDSTSISTLYASTASGYVMVCHSAWNSRKVVSILCWRFPSSSTKYMGDVFVFISAFRFNAAKSFCQRTLHLPRYNKPLVQCLEIMGGKHHQQVLPHHILVMSSHVNLCYIWVSYWPCSLLMCSLCIERLHKTIHVCLLGLPPWTMSDPLMNLPPNQP